MTYRTFIWFYSLIIMRKPRPGSRTPLRTQYPAFSIFFEHLQNAHTPTDLADSDHFDQEVEASLRRDLPIITTPHAKEHLSVQKEAAESFNSVFDVDFFEDMMVNIDSGGKNAKLPRIKVTGMPGKHVGDGLLGTLNDYARAVSGTG